MKRSSTLFRAAPVAAAAARCRGRRNGGGDAPLLLQFFNEFVEFENGEATDGFEDALNLFACHVVVFSLRGTKVLI